MKNHARSLFAAAMVFLAGCCSLPTQPSSNVWSFPDLSSPARLLAAPLHHWQCISAEIHLDGKQKSSSRLLECEALRELVCQGISHHNISQAQGRAAVPVAILDTGLLPALAISSKGRLRGAPSSRAVHAVAFSDWTLSRSNHNFKSLRVLLTDPVRHGSKVALIAAGSQTPPGVPSVPTRQWAHRLALSIPGCVAVQAGGGAGAGAGLPLFPHRVFDAQAEGHTWWFNGPLTAPCLFRSAACVINISLGGPDRADGPMRKLAVQAMSQGHLLVAAMGNDGASWDTVNDPAELLAALSVGSATVAGSKLALLLLTASGGARVGILPWLREQILAQPTVAYAADGAAVPSLEGGARPGSLREALCKHFHLGGVSDASQQLVHFCADSRALNSVDAQQIQSIALVSSFSSRGLAAGGAPPQAWQRAPKPDLLQLGDQVVYASIDGKRAETMRGTSAAAPAVAGTAAAAWGASCILAQELLAAAATTRAHELLCSMWKSSSKAVYDTMAELAHVASTPPPDTECSGGGAHDVQGGCSKFTVHCLRCTESTDSICAAAAARHVAESIVAAARMPAPPGAIGGQPHLRSSVCRLRRLVQPQAIKAMMVHAAQVLRLQVPVPSKHRAAGQAVHLTPPFLQQGAGVLASLPAVTAKSLKAQLLLQPAQLDLTDCPYMWPLCDAALHPAAPPVDMFFAATSTAGHAEALREVSIEQGPGADGNGYAQVQVRCLDLEGWSTSGCAVAQMTLVPNVTAVAVRVTATPGAPACSGVGGGQWCIPKEGRVHTAIITVCTTVLPANLAELMLQLSLGAELVPCAAQLCMRVCASLPFTARVLQQPPQTRRVAWLLSGSRTAPAAGYVLSNTLAGSQATDGSLPASFRVMQWQHGGPWGTHASLYHALRRSGFTVELHTSAWRSPAATADLPSTLLLVDPDVAPGAAERQELHTAVQAGMSMVLLAEHYDRNAMQRHESSPPSSAAAPPETQPAGAADRDKLPPYDFFDQSSQSWWKASIAGSDAPGLNRLLRKWGVALHPSSVLQGEVQVQLPVWKPAASHSSDKDAHLDLEVHLPFLAGISVQVPSQRKQRDMGLEVVTAWSALLTNTSAAWGGAAEEGDISAQVHTHVGVAVRHSPGVGSTTVPGKLVVWGDTSCVDDSLLLDRGWPPRPRGPVYLKRGGSGLLLLQQGDVRTVVLAAAEALRGLGLSAQELAAALASERQAPMRTPLHAASTMQAHTAGGADVYAGLDDGGRGSGLASGNCAALVARMVAWASLPPCEAAACAQQDDIVKGIRVN